MSRFNAGARERIVGVSLSGSAGSTIQSGPPDPASGVPMLYVSPRTPTGALTGSLAIAMFPSTIPYSAPSPGTGGFTLTIYRCVPTLGVWAALAPYTGLQYKDQLVLPDISGGWGLYFQVSNAVAADASIERVLIGVAELA